MATVKQIENEIKYCKNVVKTIKKMHKHLRPKLSKTGRQKLNKLDLQYWPVGSTSAFLTGQTC